MIGAAAAKPTEKKRNKQAEKYRTAAKSICWHIGQNYWNLPIRPLGVDLKIGIITSRPGSICRHHEATPYSVGGDDDDNVSTLPKKMSAAKAGR
jgi:hypothetical protein